MPTPPTSPSLDALVRAAVAARLAIEAGTVRDRERASADLYVALIPFVGMANLEGDCPAADVVVRYPDDLVKGRQATTHNERAPHTGASRASGSAAAVKQTASPATPGRSRWQTNGHTLAGVMAWPVPVGGDWKALGECNHDDLRLVVLHYQRKSERAGARADQFRRLLDVLYDYEEDTVGELPADLVKEVLHAR